jgi:beta-glucanase (GH16 family)
LETQRGRRARRRRTRTIRIIPLIAAAVILAASGVWALAGQPEGSRDRSHAFTATTVSATPGATPAPTTTQPPTTTKPAPKLLFADDFASLSTRLWEVADYPADVNEELQYYTPRNVTARDGLLVITAERREIGDRRYASGLVSTAGRFSFTYGTVEWRAKVPKGKGLWPALWLLGAECAATFQNRSQLCPTWPTTGSSEVDVLEVRGSEPNRANFARHVNTSPGSSDPFECDWSGPDLSAGWHTYGLRWGRSALVWTVDGVDRCRSTADVPTEPMFLIMNLAVGGKYDGDPDASTRFPQDYLIDWVRVTAPPS